MNLPTSQPPGAWGPLRNVVQRAAGPLERFLHIEAASGVVLLVVALFAFVSATSPWSAMYASLWHAQVGVQIGPFHFARTLEWIVNDGLMVIFFFVVGLEIRREIHKGELSELREQHCRSLQQWEASSRLRPSTSHSRKRL